MSLWYALGTGGVEFSNIEAFDFAPQSGPNMAITGVYAILKGVVTDGTPGTWTVYLRATLAG